MLAMRELYSWPWSVRSSCRLSALLITIWITICTVTGNHKIYKSETDITRDGVHIIGYRSWTSGKTTNTEWCTWTGEVDKEGDLLTTWKK